MHALGSRNRKCIYCYEFPDNSVYVGLTNDFYRRKSDRDTRSYDTVTQHRLLTGLNPLHKQLTDYVSVEEAIILEGKYVDEYKESGWTILNKVKTGGIGGDTLYWTYDKCLEESKKYTRRVDFNRKSKGAYESAKRNSWIEDMYKHMEYVNRPLLSWTKDECIVSASNYEYCSRWKYGDCGAFNAAKRNNWYEECTKHMIKRSW
jgi:predicted GIY-YIG superfamily endonuclease